MKSQRLKDKVIVISGGTKGVGKAAAEVLAQEGARVVFGGRDEKAAKDTLRIMRTLGTSGEFVYTDLNNIEDCRALFKKAYEKYGRIDGFFNYAGVTPISSMDTCDEDTYDWVMDVNVKACFFCCQEAIKYMRLSGGGSIVITGSPHAWSGEKDRAVYAISKGTLKVISEHIAHRYADERIRSNYLVLGWTPTEGEVKLREAFGESETELRKRVSDIVPMGRMCERNDYMEAIIYMLSDASEMMTGSTMMITGGLYI